MGKKRSVLELSFQFRWHWRESAEKYRSPPKRRPLKRFIRWLRPTVSRVIWLFIDAIIAVIVVHLWPYMLAVVKGMTEMLPQRIAEPVHCGSL